jgi:hypothetical protein
MASAAGLEAGKEDSSRIEWLRRCIKGT